MRTPLLCGYEWNLYVLIQDFSTQNYVAVLRLLLEALCGAGTVGVHIKIVLPP
jgi:hypothetical protein